MIELEASAGHPWVIATANLERDVGGNRRAGLVDAPLAREDKSRTDQRLRLRTAFGEPPLDEEDVGTLARGRLSRPPEGGGCID
jgi:hypothetical protein